MNRSLFFLPVLAVILAGALSSFYIVDEREKALRLWFGEVTAEISEPGLNFKVPFAHEIVKYDDRILPLDTDPIQVTLKDNRRFDVDAFARWRITDPKQFRRAVGSGGLPAAAARLDTILDAEMIEVLGDVDSSALLSSGRVGLMNKIRDSARTKAQTMGVEVIDVRIKRADLPEQNLEKTFERMRAERQQEAADEIARGNEAAQIIRAEADKTVVETVSKARETAEIIRGTADAERAAILAAAHGKNREFFEFREALKGYENALLNGNSIIEFSPENSEYFNYLWSSTGDNPGVKVD